VSNHMHYFLLRWCMKLLTSKLTTEGNLTFQVKINFDIGFIFFTCNW
jgi:hypothetical protein